MNRTLLIAMREFLSYAKTPGFWLSMLTLPLLFGLGFVMPQIAGRVSPAPRLVIVDMTDRNLDRDPSRWLTGTTDAAAPVIVAAPADVAAAKTPREAGALILPYIEGGQGQEGQPKISAAAIISQADDQVSVDFWSGNIADPTLQFRIERALSDVLRHERLTSLGLAPIDIAALDELRPQMRSFSPRAVNREVSLADRLPTYLGIGLGLALWSLTITGSMMLLNSTMEEKSNRILEILLQSASPWEVLGGKILGAGALTFVSFGVSIGSALITFGMTRPEMGAALAALMTPANVGYILLYFVGGYLMFASVFAAIGCFCETSREAQTLSGPIMLLMSVPLLVMILALRDPDAQVLRLLSWFPPFTPFLMAARLGSEPSAGEIIGTAVLMAGTIALAFFAASRALTRGSMSTGAATFGSMLRTLRPSAESI